MGTPDIKPLRLAEVDVVVIHGYEIVYYVGSARGWNTGPCPSPNSAIARLDAYFRGHPVDESAPEQASRAQMAWVAALGHGKLDPKAAAVAQMRAAEALQTRVHSQAWLRASAEIAHLILQRVIDLDDLAALPRSTISVG